MKVTILNTFEVGNYYKVEEAEDFYVLRANVEVEPLGLLSKGILTK